MRYAAIVAGILLCVFLSELFDEHDMHGWVVACGIALLILVGAAFCTYLDEDHEASMAERPESVWTELQEQTGATRD